MGKTWEMRFNSAHQGIMLNFMIFLKIHGTCDIKITVDCTGRGDVVTIVVRPEKSRRGVSTIRIEDDESDPYWAPIGSAFPGE